MKQSNKQARLAARIQAWTVTMQGSRESKVDLRISTGGYKKPGSNKK